MESASLAAVTGCGKLNSTTELTRVIDELTRGREIADQLLSMLRDDGASVLRTGTMVEKILESFTGSLSIVMGTTTTTTSDQYSDEVSSHTIINSQPPAIIKSEDSGESCKKPAPKDRRGCYKRRRTSETWTKETPTCYDQDGHAWRKYGQKLILNADHPRNYYRCTHKYDQQCQATKYVQKIQNEPTLYRTTYHGRHTCKTLSDSPHYNHLLMDAAVPNDSSVIWSFQSSQHDNNNNNFKSATTTMKQHKKQDHLLYQTKSSFTTHSHHLDHGNNYFISAAANPPPPNNNNDQLTARFETSSVHNNNNHLSAFSSAVSDVISSDGYSCTTSTLQHTNNNNNTTMDIGSLMDFEDFLEF